MAYQVGDKPKLTGTFKDSAGTPTDPAGTITFTIKAIKSGSQTTYTYPTDAQLQKSADGVYFVEWPIVESGRHIYRFRSGTGTGQASGEKSFVVDHEQVS